MSTLQIRFGGAEDRAEIVGSIRMAGAGIFEHLLDGVLPGVKAEDLLLLAVSDLSSPYHFDNAVLVEEKGEVLGCMLGYPAGQYELPAMLRTMIPKSRLAPLQHLIEGRVDDSFYINTLAVREDSHRRGIGRVLLETAAGIAEEGGFQMLSLHVWKENTIAVDNYRSIGFEFVDEVPMPKSEHLLYDGPMILMRAPVKNLLS